MNWSIVDWGVFIVAVSVCAPAGFMLGHRFQRWQMRVMAEELESKRRAQQSRAAE